MGLGLSKISPKCKKLSPSDKAILDLKFQRDKLHHYSKQLQLVLSQEVNMAKEALAVGNKDKALLILKKKKMQEQLHNKSLSILTNIEEMINSIEFSMIERKIFDSLKEGNRLLQLLNNELSIEKINKLIDETAEAVKYQKEVEEILGQSLSPQDEAEITSELESLLTSSQEVIDA
ncbi:hypothetical protein Zmor_011964 [Zophobas morio]|uniref:Charged multivesicular body protein 6 n=1 Tax=Zophobas morio TaxID=2755281 RepID=A0AA38HG42_9CUCU|nr:hypothetical protein Zmor_011964 [Zophobas morio]